MVYRFLDFIPQIDKAAILLDNVTIIGRVQIAAKANIWFNCVIRGDINSISIGEFCNIQDGSIIHVDHDFPTIVGSGVTVGHGAIIHGCEIKSNSLIGMGATILNGAVVEEGAIVAAGALVKEKFTVPARTLAAGVPAKIIRPVSDIEYQAILKSAKHYYETAMQYQNNYVREEK
ncbi:MAG TPA: gamma carbonic anhydrase family protein [Candidatus Marinimicrobia bacterium]|mgnify:CR=1 FL=1|nr:gamma carbonic anhydrase family protein [Candidatus Neomarinimicrobiota bacterium]